VCLFHNEVIITRHKRRKHDARLKIISLLAKNADSGLHHPISGMRRHVRVGTVVGRKSVPGLASDFAKPRRRKLRALQPEACPWLPPPPGAVHCGGSAAVRGSLLAHGQLEL
jgi:hypothetical protein